MIISKEDEKQSIVCSSLFHKRQLTPTGRGRAGGRCVIYNSLKRLCQSEVCTTVAQSPPTASTSGSSCRGAALDTDLSHVNKSQAHQAECCCWQAAPLCSSEAWRGGLQPTLQSLLHKMFAFFLPIIPKHCGFLLLSWLC